MTRLRILAPTRYPWRFNGPRQSRHDISVRAFAPFNKISEKIEGVTVFNPLPLRRFDLVHGFNRIPLGRTPFVMGFESHLPRAFGLEDTVFFRALSRMLVGERCRGIFAISEYARGQMLRQHAGRPWEAAIASKLGVRYPNLPLPPGPDAFAGEKDGPIRLVFVGAHFGRKGGPVAVRLAALARKRGLAVEVDVVSSLETGLASWVDPLTPGFFDKDIALLRDLPNVRHHGYLPNGAVLDLIAGAHFLLLPTFSDSFGFSAIEAMARHTPVLATRQCALPEFIEDGVNGVLLSLENGAAGEWAHIGRQDRDTAAYAALFDAETDRLAEEAFARLSALAADPAAYAGLRVAARSTAARLFAAEPASLFWDDLYERACA